MSRVLKRGVAGDDVSALQERLRAQGYTVPRSGTYDAATERAVKSFQRSNRLAPDGDAGRKTLSALGFRYGGGGSPRPHATPSPAGEGRGEGQTVTPTTTPPITVRPATTTPSTITPSTVTPRIVLPELQPANTTATTRLTAAELGPLSERHALAVSLVQPRGAQTTQADVDAVVGALEQMPVADLQELKRANLPVIACRESVVDAFPELGGQKPRGWPPGATWDKVPGAFVPDHHAVVIATVSAGAGAREVPPTNVRHGSTDLVSHEVGHALDSLRGYPSKNDRDFKRAYAADLLAGNLQAYYSQGGEAGPSEAYAETLAMMLKGDPFGAGARSMPNVMAYWKAHYRAEAGT